MLKNITEASIRYVKGVGPSRKKLFTQLGVESIEDLLYLFPRRYEDRRQMTKICEVSVGNLHTVAGKIVSCTSRQAWHTKKHLCEIVIDDGSAKLYGVWFHQPYIANYFSVDKKVVLHGKVDTYKDRLQIVSPEYEIIDDEDDEQSLSIGRIVPIYPLTKGLTQRYLRRIIKFCLDNQLKNINDVLPYDLRNKYKLMNLSRSLANIHFPETMEVQEDAIRRISFEEFYLFQVSMLLRKESIIQKEGEPFDANIFTPKAFQSALPFTLTNAQKRVITEITTDLSKTSPMHRLLQGEVGAGKTIVALYGCFAAIRNGYQAAILAPTEILARQHFETITQIIDNKIFSDVKVGLLIGSLDKKQKDAMHQKIKRGGLNLIVGTHALLQESVDFKDLQFAVIDEQHKFGVRQRAILPEKGTNPNVLIMTATPIPRTLCLTLYGDLDISTLDELPAGRGKTRTEFFIQERASDAYDLVCEKIQNGQQAYIVYPIIDESEKLELKAAKEMFNHLKKDVFSNFEIGLVHGQMKRKDAENIMNDFKNKKLDILIATTILEVGIDVSNANVIIIEHAERFGLSQLHQLRGRIGRGSEDAVCILIGAPASPEALARIDAILSTNDGFQIAQKDLMIRGPGQFFGRHQHGLNELRVANPATQLDILELARKEAKGLIAQDSSLSKGQNVRIRALIEKRYPSYLSMVRAG